MTPSAEERAPNRTVEVLIVEDAMDQALLLTTFLRSEGSYHVTHAQDGDRAIALLDDRDFDVVVTDLNLPGTDGFNVMRHIRDNGMDVRVLAVTGHTEPQFTQEAFRAGAAEVLHKPLEKDEVLSRVRQLLPDDVFAKPHRSAVMAVGARPGDVEVGCGGALSRHVEAGADVLIVLLSGRMEEGGADGTDAARRSAGHLGARIVMADPEGEQSGGPGELQIFLNETAGELRPAVAYVPAPGDSDMEREMASRISVAALADTPLVLGYPTVSSGGAAEAEHFTNVGEQMAHKAESLAYYQGLRMRRQDLTADFIQEQAERAGSEAGVEEAEGFVVVDRGSQGR